MNVADTASPVTGTLAFRPAIPARHFQKFFVTHVIVASIASLLLISQGTSDEPYMSFRASDALFQIGLGCALIAMWLYLIGGTFYGVATARLSKQWLLLLPWAIIVLFYLRICPQGFVEDIIKFAPKP